MRFPLPGQFKWTLVNQIRIYMAVQATLAQRFFELVDNGQDAGAKKVLLGFFHGKFQISDDGNGMGPEILAEDVDKLLLFWDQIEKSTITPGYEIRETLNRGSKSSLEWLELCPAFSPKVTGFGTQSTPQKGVLGIGFQGVRRIGASVVVSTKPSRELAASSWGPTHEWTLNPPVFQLRLHTPEELSAYKVEPDVTVVENTPLYDVLGNVLASGTVITITDLFPGIAESLRLEQLKDQMQTRFGGDIENGLQIGLYDGITKPGKLHLVPPAEYKGYPVFDRGLSLKGQGKIQFQIRLWYDPNGKNLKVKIRRYTSNVADLEELERTEFVRTPLTSGKLTGYIEYPVTAGEPWDTNKRIPPAGVTLNQWVNAIKAIIPEVEGKIKEIDDLAAEELNRQAARELSRAASRALGEMGLLGGFKGDKGQRPNGGKTRKPRTPPDVLDQILIRIEDENRQGVAEVGVVLTRTDTKEVIASRKTTTSGWVNFGHYNKVYGDGPYQVQISLPEGVVLAEGEVDHRRFGIGKRYNQVGYRTQFAVVSGQRKRNTHPLRSLTIVSRPLSDPTRTYDDSMLDAGMLMTNSGHELYRQANERHDRDTIDAFNANCVGVAVSEMVFGDYPREDQNNQAVVISTRILSALREVRRSRRS